MSLVQVAKTEGYEAYHVVYLGMAGNKDWQIIQAVIAEITHSSQTTRLISVLYMRWKVVRFGE